MTNLPISIPALTSYSFTCLVTGKYWEGYASNKEAAIAKRDEAWAKK